jgi:hypothetical protein
MRVNFAVLHEQFSANESPSASGFSAVAIPESVVPVSGK